MSEPDLIGKRFGHLRVIGLAGQGGMGAVYLGFDEKLQRRVALKALHETRLLADRKARFLREARALSQLKHPNICQIYDYLETGERDLLVLELIEGRTLAALAETRPGEATGLRLARQLADALAAAHAQGIVHRDLKPTNVMVTAAGEVKVLDFGLARVAPAIESTPTRDIHDAAPLQDETDSAHAVTVLGAVMGTLGYMSPEQARGEPVTAASDIYSLGLVLQNLFTGRPVYEPGLDRSEQLRRVQSAQTLPVVGVRPQLSALIERMKAATPAVRPSAFDAAERLRWIAEAPRRRLKRLALGAALVIATLVAVIMTYQAFRIRREVERANRETEGARQVSEFLVKLFEVSDPTGTRGNQVTARELLDEAARDIQGRLADQPIVKARLLHSMGQVYTQLGLHQPALALAQQSLELRRASAPADEAPLAESLLLLALIQGRLGSYETAEPRFREGLALQEQALGPDHAELGKSLDVFGIFCHERGKHAEAEQAYKRSLAILEKALGSGHRDVAASLNNLANLYITLGKSEEAEQLQRRALAIQEKVLAPDHMDIAATLNNLATLDYNRGRYAQAESLYSRSLAILEKALGPGHSKVALLRNNLGSVAQQLGHLDDALAAFTASAEGFEKALGPAHPMLAAALGNLADVYRDLGRENEAEAQLQRALAIEEKALGPDNADVAIDRHNLGLLYLDTGRLERAQPLLERAAAVFEKIFGPAHARLARALRSLAALRHAQGRRAEAEALYRRALAIQEKAPDANGPDRADTLARLASLLQESGQRDAALPLLGHALEILDKLPPHDAATTPLKAQRASVLLLLGRTAEARPLAEGVFAAGYRRGRFVELCRRNRIV